MSHRAPPQNGAALDGDEAFDDDDDVCVDGELDDAMPDFRGELIEGRCLSPSTDVIVVLERRGKSCSLWFFSSVSHELLSFSPAFPNLF